MKIVYIAAPYSAPTPWNVEVNVRRAEGIALEVARLGAMPLCPHPMTRFIGGDTSIDSLFWYAGTLELARRCDAVFVCLGSENSKGAQLEIEDAEMRGIPIFRSICALEDWVKNGTIHGITAG